MRRVFFIFLIIAARATLALSLPVPVAHAHELIPKPVVDYIRTHPNASAQDIEQFVQQSDPAYAQKFKSKEELINATRISALSWWRNALLFIKFGILHILTGPDHVLFVISIVLVYESLRKLLKLTGAFTIAHSITLILSGTAFITVGSRIVEPAIAFSIAYVALTSVFLKNSKYQILAGKKAAAVFFFGLFHGLGFATLLRDIRIPADRFIPSLLFFNVGIELGQLMILAVIVPIVLLLWKKSWYPTAIRWVGGAIGTTGIVWGLVRIFN